MFRQGDDSLLKDLKTGIVEHPSKPFKLKQWKKWKFIELRRTLCLNVIYLVPEVRLCNSKENLLCVVNPLLFVNESGHMPFSQQA